MEAKLSPNDTLDNRYLILWRAGQGKAGGAVYAAKDTRSPEGTRVALKFPAKDAELEALKALQRRCDEANEKCFWMPRVCSCGHFRGHPYAATEMLSRPLTSVFERIKGLCLGARWRVLRPLGRLLVRRLEAIHRHGFVHCDIQPNNILMHSPAGDSVLDERPYFVDFGTAARYPGGEPQRPDRGSVDFNSVNSAGGGVRGPCDDLESVGWVLAFGLFGELPWFETTKISRWVQGRLSEEDCPRVCGEVRDAKLAMMTSGGRSFGPRWDHLEDTPLELARFLRLACAGAKAAGPPDYVEFARALGDKTGSSPAESELVDLAEYRAATAAATSPDGGEVEDPRTLRNPGPEEVPPHLVEVEVHHAVSENESMTVEVMSSCSVRDVRLAVLAKLGTSKLSEVKLVKRMGTGENPTFASFDDKQPIEDRRKFWAMGRSLVVRAAPKKAAEGEPAAQIGREDKVDLTLERALVMQADFLKCFSEETFQARLHKLRIAHNFQQQSPQFRQAHSELCFEVQRELLPSYGFPPTRMGVVLMMRSFKPFFQNEEIVKNAEAINKAIGAPELQH